MGGVHLRPVITQWLRPCQQSLNVFNDSIHQDWFSQIAINVGFEIGRDKKALRIGGHDDDDRVTSGRLRLADFSSDLEAADTGQPNIKQYQIGQFGLEKNQASFARCRLENLVATSCQGLSH